MTPNSKYTEMKVEKGGTIFNEGDVRDALFVVKAGQIAILKTLPDGSLAPLGIISSGEYLGETGLMDGKTHHATLAIALTDVELIRIPSKVIEDQLKQAPPWLLAISKGLSQKLRRMNDLVRRNKLTDESLQTIMRAIDENDTRQKATKK